ncbi:MAG: 50S ribosomal protein L6 [Clostridia bacterium]|nr:50S ribosomal protein L6 [Clostridia bacterium]
MSRIGRAPIAIPAGVNLTVDGQNITVKGPKGTLSCTVDTTISFKVENNEIVFTRSSEHKDIRAKHGLYRALVANMVKGVTTGFEKSVIINGVGYKAQVNGNKLILNIGYSHPCEVVAPDGITFECPSATEILVKGFDKELVGQTAANLKALRPVEPYHAYGVRYKTDVVVLKEGKKAGK